VYEEICGENPITSYYPDFIPTGPRDLHSNSKTKKIDPAIR